MHIQGRKQESEEEKKNTPIEDFHCRCDSGPSLPIKRAAVLDVSRYLVRLPPSKCIYKDESRKVRRKGKKDKRGVNARFDLQEMRGGFHTSKWGKASFIVTHYNTRGLILLVTFTLFFLARTLESRCRTGIEGQSFSKLTLQVHGIVIPRGINQACPEHGVYSGTNEQGILQLEACAVSPTLLEGKVRYSKRKGEGKPPRTCGCLPFTEGPTLVNQSASNFSDPSTREVY